MKILVAVKRTIDAYVKVRVRSDNTGVDLTNKYPPYTLMRYTLNDAGEVVTTALADNIRSMEFKYWEDASAKTALRDLTETKITDFSTVGGLGQYDPNNANVIIGPRLIRGKVRAVTATIVGMNPQADYNYTNPTDTVASNYRQYTLQSTIVGRNLGLRGMPQSNTNPPGPPTVKNACNGYCGVAYLTWAPAPGSGDETYTVLYDTSASGSFSGVLPAGTQTYYAVDLTQLDLSKTYYFRVAATNAAGSVTAAPRIWPPTQSWPLRSTSNAPIDDSGRVPATPGFSRTCSIAPVSASNRTSPSPATEIHNRPSGACTSARTLAGAPLATGHARCSDRPPGASRKRPSSRPIQRVPSASTSRAVTGRAGPTRSPPPTAAIRYRPAVLPYQTTPSASRTSDCGRAAGSSSRNTRMRLPVAGSSRSSPLVVPTQTWPSATSRPRTWRAPPPAAGG